MAGTKEIQIRCEHCDEWFSAPIKFGGEEAFSVAALIGNTIQCTGCGKMTGCNKENMRARSTDGSWGFVGDDTT